MLVHELLTMLLFDCTSLITLKLTDSGSSDALNCARCVLLS